jgi:hypothetical protein
MMKNRSKFSIVAMLFTICVTGCSQNSVTAQPQGLCGIYGKEVTALESNAATYNSDTSGFSESAILDNVDVEKIAAKEGYAWAASDQDTTYGGILSSSQVFYISKLLKSCLSSDALDALDTVGTDWKSKGQ